MKLVLGRQNPTFSVVAVQLRADITYSKATVSVVIDERGLNKYARDYVNEIDQLTFAVSKGLQTVQQVQDAISSLGLTKPAADSAWSDDELSISVGYIRAFLETLATSDQLLGLQFSKGLFDTVTALESITGLGIETFYEDFQLIEDNADANSGDGLEYADVKPAADPVGTSDQATSAIGKALQDAVTELETLTADFGKPLEDQYAASDVLTALSEKALSDSYYAADTLSYLFDAVRTITDSTLTIDVLASIGVEKLLTDALSTVSSGSLRMTDYVDITYLAEDYVGTSTTFS